MSDILSNEGGFNFLKTALNASSTGHQMNAANLANIDTPGYKSKRMDFESILQDFEDSEAMQPGRLSRSDRQLRPGPVLNFKDYVIEEEDGHLVERFDGNNVDLDKEMAHMGKMRGRYELATMFLNRKVRLVNEAIMSH